MGDRPYISGKFLWQGSHKLYIRGVTYGPFRPEADGSEYHTPDRAGRDFAMISAAGFNAVRVYTVPPRWLLDLAGEHHLLVFAGLPWEQHVTFLHDRTRARDIQRRVREGMRSVAGHPALLGVAVGNEIPSSIVRWHGNRKIERFLHRLYDTAKAEDPAALITYVNFPSTEYLDLGFLDFSCFNVYLETPEKLTPYVNRLRTLAGDTPLVMAEIGLDSMRHGLTQQAETLAWQIDAVMSRGACGAFIFSWTDEWFRGGHDINDWHFGLTTAARESKPALEAVKRAFARVPVGGLGELPSISVVVCSYNGSRTIRDTLDHLQHVAYPNFETIVVSDGSTDATAAIAREYSGVRVIETPNRGLSAARNEGMNAATGEIIAYIDDDAYPDPHWLHYLAHGYHSSSHVAMGGPNLPPLGDGPIAHCVAHAPGGPIQVLLTDDLAEHTPGCNLSIRRKALQEIGGFDPVFRVAGDDVDVCWRLQDRGGTIGFHHAAMVWHHRRNSLKAYWKQQRGYGKAEALLERKWPERYNTLGHLRWAGRLYGAGVIQALALRNRVYYGTWNSAPFQSLYSPPLPLWQGLTQMPEWYGVNAILAVLVACGFSWPPLLWLTPMLAVCVLIPLLQAMVSGWRATHARTSLRLLTISLFVIQPIARLWGRLAHGLTPWRRSGKGALHIRGFRTSSWSEIWRSQQDWLARIQSSLRDRGSLVRPGGDYDTWDIEIGTVFGGARLRVAVEEHGAGKQLLVWRVWRRVNVLLMILAGAAALMAIAAMRQQGRTAAFVLGLCAAVLLVRIFVDGARSIGSIRESIRDLQQTSKANGNS